jgi:hypothetical protein
MHALTLAAYKVTLNRTARQPAQVKQRSRATTSQGLLADPPAIKYRPRAPRQEPGPEPLQPQPGSAAQAPLQPAPAAEPPSSQASLPVSCPLPHAPPELDVGFLGAPSLAGPAHERAAGLVGLPTAAEWYDKDTDQDTGASSAVNTRGHHRQRPHGAYRGESTSRVTRCTRGRAPRAAHPALAAAQEVAAAALSARRARRWRARRAAASRARAWEQPHAPCAASAAAAHETAAATARRPPPPRNSLFWHHQQPS